MKRLSDTPVWLRLTAAIWLLLIIVWASFIAWETRVSRDIAIDQSQLFANTINDMTMAGLTGMMINGTIANRAVFLDQIERLDALRELRVLRGDAVSSAFGRPEGELAPDAVEARVLASGEAYRAVEASAEGGQHLRVILPTLASDNYLGKNCLMCHQVTAGTPLGAVSMRIALDRVDASVSQFRNASAIFALVASLPVVLIVFFFVRRVVTRPLERMSEGLRDLARGEGDLTRRLAVAGNDEIGQTGLRFNEMLATIAQLVREVGDSARDVTGAAVTLSGDAGRIAESSTLQFKRSSEADGSVARLAESVTTVAEHAGAVSKLSRESEARTAEGRTRVERLIHDVSEVAESVRQIGESVRGFVESAKQISVMTQEVREIADQTNLLALNAAIEAARAGEHGRGFAVVADEVRKLAEKSARSAAEIDAITRSISEKSDAVSESLRIGDVHLQESRSAADEVAEVLDQAARTVADVRQGLDRITAETVQQNDHGHDVKESISAIARMASDNQAAVERAVGAARTLEDLAQRLQASVARFRT
ncbi:MAG: methyl-accepting chemotaxis protein [Rhodocyclaceae bacterium]|nr:methyl-accepting chemotaxis protein [Rhodocyclaceae bacterium]